MSAPQRLVNKDPIKSRMTSAFTEQDLDAICWLQTIFHNNHILEAKLNTVDGNFDYKYDSKNVAKIRKEGQEEWTEYEMGGSIRNEDPCENAVELHNLFTKIGATEVYMTENTGATLQYTRQAERYYAFGPLGKTKEYHIVPAPTDIVGPFFFKEKNNLFYNENSLMSDPGLICAPCVIININKGFVLEVGEESTLEKQLINHRQSLEELTSESGQSLQMLSLKNLTVDQMTRIVNDPRFTKEVYNQATKKWLSTGQKDEELIKEPYLPLLKLRFPNVPELLIKKALEPGKWVPERFDQLKKIQEKGIEPFIEQKQAKGFGIGAR